MDDSSVEVIGLMSGKEMGGGGRYSVSGGVGGV